MPQRAAHTRKPATPRRARAWVRLSDEALLKVRLCDLDLTVEDRVYTLSEGDCFAFQSSLAHSFKNSGAVASAILWVNMRSQNS